MAAKSRQYICLNKDHKKLLEDRHLEEILDTRDRADAPLRTRNARKSLEHYLERKQLKETIADFDWPEVRGHGKH
jgi:hypothetical protein